MRILVIGSGGREHALLHAMHGHELTVAPGNAGMSGLATVRSVDVASPDEIVALARDIASAEPLPEPALALIDSTPMPLEIMIGLFVPDAAEAMVAIVLAEAVLEKFGGDSVAETARNHRAYLDAIPELMKSFESQEGS